MFNLLLDRRRLLLGLAAASTAAAAPAVAGVAPVLENPELLRLADLLPAALAERAAATAHKAAVVAEWSPAWPIAPDAICDGYATGFSTIGETGLTGAPMLANGERPPLPPHGLTGREWSEHVDKCRADPAAHYPRVVMSAKWLASRRDDCLKKLRRQRPKHPLSPVQVAELETLAGDYSQKAALAAAYETECARIKAASGYAAAVARDKAAFDALAKLVGEIITAPAETMAGVIVKAQALAAWEADRDAIIHPASWSWPGAFASEVLAIASA